MVNYSMAPGLFPRLTGLAIALALLLSVPPAFAQWQRVGSENPAFSIEMPDGWSLREVEGRGARLLSPENDPVVEIVAWTALRPPATPENAAIEHEGVLSRAVDYRRDAIEQIETDEGAPALLVTGRVRSRGITEDSFFAAYAEGATHYVLGTFGSKDRLAALRSDVLDRMVRSFRAESGAAPVARPPLPGPEPVDPQPEPAPQPPPEPEAEPMIAEPEPGPPVISEPETQTGPTSVGINGGERPVEPEVREPRTPWIEHAGPGGFSVSIPMDWEVATTDGLITLTPAVEAAGVGTVLIWPVTGSDPGAEAALRMALTRVQDIRLMRVTSIEDLVGGTLLDAATTGGRRVSATWAHDGAFGLLQAVIAPDAAWRGELPAMARMAASFRPGEWPVAHRPEVEVVGDMGLLRWKLPVGWQVRGGVREEGGEVSIDVEALGPSDEALRIGWQQPMLPRFRALTPLLESLGWREGERYSVPEGGGGGLLIYARREPERLVREMLLPRHPRELRLSAIEAEPATGAIADLLTQPDAIGQVVTVRGGSAIGPRERIYLAATARAEPPLSTTCWDAASLRADAPEGRLSAAVEALMTMVRTAAVADAATVQQSERLHDMIGRAQRAAGAIPDDLRPERDTGLTSVLGGETPGTTAATWRMPADANDYWSAQTGPDTSVDLPGAPVETRPRG